MAGITHMGMTQSEMIRAISDNLFISERTARRWINEKDAAHPCAILLLKNLFLGFPQHGRWRGWQLNNDYLTSPTGETLTPDQIGKLWLWQNEKRTLQSRIASQQNEIERLSSQQSVDTMEKVTQAYELLRGVISHRQHSSRRSA